MYQAKTNLNINYSLSFKKVKLFRIVIENKKFQQKNNNKGLDGLRLCSAVFIMISPAKTIINNFKIFSDEV